MHFSPALARSTISPRRITSMVRGMLPVGISELFSWILTFCQSTKVDCLMSSRQPSRFPQVTLGHCVGSVYLNVCSMLGTTVLQFSQVKVAIESSGRTSDVRVTVPEMDNSVPTVVVRSWRTREISGRL